MIEAVENTIVDKLDPTKQLHIRRYFFRYIDFLNMSCFQEEELDRYTWVSRSILLKASENKHIHRHIFSMSDLDKIGLEDFKRLDTYSLISILVNDMGVKFTRSG